MKRRAASSKESEDTENHHEKALIACLTRELSAPTDRKVYDFLTHEIASSKALLIAATTAATEKPIYTIDKPTKRKSFNELMFGLDQEFNSSFKLTRITIRSIVSDLKITPEYKQEDDSSVGKSICLLAYFLANENVSLKEIRTVFAMKDEEQVVDEMVRVSKALQDVSGRVRLRWPLEHESLEIGEKFIRKFKFPDVMGVMCSWVFGDGILLQTVVDDSHMYLDINATEIVKKRPTPIEFYFRTATYSYVTNFLPQDFNILANSSYPDRIPNVVTPFVNRGNLSDKELNFNKMLKACLELPKQTIQFQRKRFPRLDNIGLSHSAAKHIILGSCVLHNASLYYHDLAPF